jgi:hypothetical protein
MGGMGSPPDKIARVRVHGTARDNWAVPPRRLPAPGRDAPPEPYGPTDAFCGSEATNPAGSRKGSSDSPTSLAGLIQNVGAPKEPFWWWN